MPFAKTVTTRGRPRGSTVVPIKKARKLYDSGWTCRKIGLHFGLKTRTVHSALVSAGVKMRSTWAIPDQDPKTCRDCGQSKSLKDFYPASKSHQRPERGWTRYSSYCKPCQRKRQYPFWLARKYGIKPERVQRMFVRQSGRCLLCRRLGMRLCIDHNSRTGQIRGALLCIQCNAGIEQAFTDPTWLIRAAKYVKATRSR